MSVRVKKKEKIERGSMGDLCLQTCLPTDRARSQHTKTTRKEGGEIACLQFSIEIAAPLTGSSS